MLVIVLTLDDLSCRWIDEFKGIVSGLTWTSRAISTSLESSFYEVLDRHSSSRSLWHSRNVHFDKLTLEDKKGSKKIFNRGFFVRAKASSCVHSIPSFTSNDMGGRALLAVLQRVLKGS